MKAVLSSLILLPVFISTTLFAQVQPNFDTSKKNSLIKFQDYTTGHLMFMTTNDFNRFYGFQTINGVQIGSSFYVGLGVGLDIFSIESNYLTKYLPLFLNISSGTQEGSVRAYLSLSFGYGLCILTPDPHYNIEYNSPYDDGFMFDVSVGASIYIHHSLHYLLGFGFKRQADGTPSFNEYKMLGIETGVSF